MKLTILNSEPSTVVAVIRTFDFMWMPRELSVWETNWPDYRRNMALINAVKFHYDFQNRIANYTSTRWRMRLTSYLVELENTQGESAKWEWDRLAELSKRIPLTTVVEHEKEEMFLIELLRAHLDKMVNERTFR